MATLTQQDIKDIADYIRANEDRIKINAKLFEIYEGNLIGFVKEALQDELARKSFEQVSHRISPINVNKRLVTKLSRLYMNPPTRTQQGGTQKDQELIDFYSENFRINRIMADANVFFNSQRYCLIQPYLDSKTNLPKLRAIPASRFLIRSTDPEDHTRPTEIIVCMGTKVDEGVRKKEFWVFTDEQIVKMLSDGKVIESVENPVGVIPFIYINRTRHNIMPAPDTDLLQISILIPVLLSDMNYATKFQAFSIIYGIDLDMDNIHRGPDNIWNFKSDSEGRAPKVDILTPKVDLDKMLSSVEAQLSMFFETRNLKHSANGRATTQNVNSGIALMIQNLDITEDIKEQREIFVEAEKELWDLIIDHMHPFWVDQYKNEKRAFSKDVSVNIEFPEIKPMSSEDEIIDREIRLIASGLSSKEISLRKLHPRKSEEEIRELLDKIEDDNNARPLQIEVNNSGSPASDAQGSSDEGDSEENS